MSIVKIKVAEALKEIKFGTPQDDSVYIRFVLGDGSVGHKIVADITASGRKYTCTLRGENEIINYEGEKVTTSQSYLSYAIKGRAGLDMLNFNKSLIFMWKKLHMRMI